MAAALSGLAKYRLSLTPKPRDAAESPYVRTTKLMDVVWLFECSRFFFLFFVVVVCVSEFCRSFFIPTSPSFWLPSFLAVALFLPGKCISVCFQVSFTFFLRCLSLQVTSLLSPVPFLHLCECRGVWVFLWYFFNSLSLQVFPSLFLVLLSPFSRVFEAGRALISCFSILRSSLRLGMVASLLIGYFLHFLLEFWMSSALSPIVFPSFLPLTFF